VASDVDICNLALSHLAQEVTVTDINPSDGSFESDKCAVFYPIARDKLLEMHSWRFATYRKALTLNAVNELEGMWAYSYAVPNLCLKPLLVLPPESVNEEDARKVTFEVETTQADVDAIYTNQQDAFLKYIKRVTDTARFSPGFVVTVSWLLAHYLAGPIVKKKEVVKWCYDNFLVEYVKATSLDASARRTNRLQTYVAGHLAARKV
jgi:hypothetical protein